MRRRNRTGSEADLGPPEGLKTGAVVVSFGPDVDDPNKTVRRAKRVWAPDTLLAKGAITPAHHAAACKYLEQYQRGVLGAGRNRSIVPMQRSAGPGGYQETQLAAAKGYRDATAAVGTTLTPALAWCVLSHGTVAGWAECRGWNPHKAAGYLIAALDRLAEHYGMV